MLVIIFNFHFMNWEKRKTAVRVIPVCRLFFTVHETEFPLISEMNGNIYSSQIGLYNFA
jgi:hypothetical protein